MTMERFNMVSCTIIVYNIPNNVTEDQLTIHFQKRKVGGGDVSHVQFLKAEKTDSKTAVVTFDDPKDAVTVLENKHVISSALLDIKLFNDQMFTETRVTIQNKILQQFASLKKQTFDICLINLANTYALSFYLMEGPDEWQVCGHWFHLKLLNYDIKDTLKMPSEDSKVERNMEFSQNKDNVLTVSRDEWLLFEKSYSSELLQVFSKSLMQSQVGNYQTLQLNIFNGGDVLKDELKKFISQKTSNLTDTKFVNSSSFTNVNNFLPDTSLHFNNPTFQEVKKVKVSTTVVRKIFTFENVQVKICQGDITEEVVDGIVNAANNELFHSGGVAKAISDASKDNGQMQRFCHDYVKKNGNVPVSQVVVSQSGELPCSIIIHAIGPEWYKYGKEAIKLLENTFFNCLQKANLEKLSSLALPLISSGIFGVPKDVAANCLVVAVDHFIKEPEKYLKDIRFIDPDFDTVNIVLKAFDFFVTTDSIKEFGKKDDSKGFFSGITHAVAEIAGSFKNTSKENKFDKYENKRLEEKTKGNRSPSVEALFWKGSSIVGRSENELKNKKWCNENTKENQIFVETTSKQSPDVSTWSQNPHGKINKAQQKMFSSTDASNYKQSFSESIPSNNSLSKVQSANQSDLNHQSLIRDNPSISDHEYSAMEVDNDDAEKNDKINIDSKENINEENKPQLVLDMTRLKELFPELSSQNEEHFKSNNFYQLNL